MTTLEARHYAQECAEVREEGREARRAGVSREACPYRRNLSHAELYALWLKGWDEADAVERLNALQPWRRDNERETQK